MNRRIDPWLVATTALLIGIGLVMVYSASAIIATERAGDAAYFLKRQLMALGVGSVLCIGTAFTPTRILRRYRVAVYSASLVGLVLCYVPGIQYKANGAARWLGVGSVHVQPSEFAKLAVLVMLAHYLERWRGQLGDWRVLLRAALIPAPVMALILGEPDFGTTAIIAGLCAMMLFVAGMRRSHMAALVGTGVVVGVPVMMAETYRLQRLTSFRDPWSNYEAEGYHIIQSWVAMHSGGFWGQGLGNSLAKLHFLPEPWTDFIAAVIAEELGWVALVAIIGIYGLLVWRSLHVARRARDAFGTFLAATIGGMIGFEAFFNLAVVMGVVPPKGLVLPFISYGSTAMMSHLWAVGLLLSIAAEADPEDVPVTAGWPRRRGVRPSPAK